MNIFANIKPRYEGKYFFSLLWAIILAADLIFVSFFIAGERNSRRYIDNNFNAEIIREFNDLRKGADLGIVFLGNSRLRYAIPFGTERPEIVALPDGRRAAVLKFALNAARFDIYAADISYRVLKSRPDLIVVQDSIISNAPSEVKRAATFARTVFEFFVKSIKGVDEYQEWLDDRLDVNPDGKCFKRFTKQGMETQLQFNADRDHHSLSDDNPGYKAAKEFFMMARMAEIKMAVVRIPPSTESMARVGEPIHKSDFYGLGYMPTLADLLPKEYETVAWIDSPPEQGEEFYCDYVHLNSKGRKVFSDWLLAQIVRL